MGESETRRFTVNFEKLVAIVLEAFCKNPGTLLNVLALLPSDISKLLEDGKKTKEITLEALADALESLYQDEDTVSDEIGERVLAIKYLAAQQGIKVGNLPPLASEVFGAEKPWSRKRRDDITAKKVHQTVQEQGSKTKAAQVLGVSMTLIGSRLREFEKNQKALVGQESGKRIKGFSKGEGQGEIVQSPKIDSTDQSGVPEETGNSPDWKLPIYQGLSPYYAEEFLRESGNNVAAAIKKANEQKLGIGITPENFTNLIGRYRKILGPSGLTALLKKHNNDETAAFKEAQRETGIPQSFFSALVEKHNKDDSKKSASTGDVK